MNKPVFDRFHPNYDACEAACRNAENGDFRKAKVFLEEANCALEYPENAEDNRLAWEYVTSLAEAAGVDLYA